MPGTQSVRTFCTVSRRPAGPLAPPPRRPGLRCRCRSRSGPDQRPVGWREDETRGRLTLSQFTSAREVAPAPAAGLSGAGQNPSRPSVTAGQPHPLSCLVNVHAKTALSRTCPDQEMAAIGSRDPSGQLLTLKHQGSKRALPLVRQQFVDTNTTVLC